MSAARSGPPRPAPGARSPGLLILLKDIGHPAGSPAAGLGGLLAAGRAGFVREVEAAGLAYDGVRCRLEDDGERLDPAQFLLAEPDGGSLLRLA
jgi:hypothetical protein